jgi:hypothetical protein
MEILMGKPCRCGDSRVIPTIDKEEPSETYRCATCEKIRSYRRLRWDSVKNRRGRILRWELITDMRNVRVRSTVRRA